MRPAVADCLSELANEDDRLVMVVADGHALGLALKQTHPERFIDVGIAEATLVGVASGIARTGRRVVVAAMAPFLTRRALEQVRNDVSTADLPVTLIGVGGGLSYGSLGPTHHTPEDLSVFGGLPHTQVYCPADAASAAWSVRDAVHRRRPAYVRLGARTDRVVFDERTRWSSAAGEVIRRPVLSPRHEVLVISSGATIAVALDAAEWAQSAGVAVTLLALTVVSPFPEDQVLALAGSANTVCTIEEALGPGGIGEATARTLAGRWSGAFHLHAIDNRYPPVTDRRGLFEFYGLKADRLIEALLDSGSASR